MSRKPQRRACPECQAPLSANGTFCKECCFDADLMEGDGEGLLGPDEGDASAPEPFDYDGFLQREGIAHSPVSVGLWIVLGLALLGAAYALVRAA